jgi:hypothetical protein
LEKEICQFCLGVLVLALVFLFLPSGVLEYGHFVLTDVDWYHFLQRLMHLLKAN